MFRARRGCSLNPITLTMFFLLALHLGLTGTPQTQAATQSENPQALPSGGDAAYELDDSKGVVVPFNRNDAGSPWITVQARINGSKLYTFVVDTGDPDPLFIQQWAQDELKIPLSGKTVTIQPGNLVSQLTGGCDLQIKGRDEGINVDLHADSAAVGNIPLLESCSRPRIAGIIGVRTFTVLTSRFDFEKQTLTFFSFKHPVVHPKGTFANLRLLDSKGSQVLRASFEVSGAGAVPFWIDTGDLTTYFPAAGANLIDRVCTQGGAVRTDLGGDRPTLLMMIGAIRAGAITIAHPEVSINMGAESATLCMDALSCFRVTIDPGNRVLTLEPRKNFRYRRPGRTGIVLSTQGDRMIVSQIQLVNTANTDLQINDKIVSIDGIAAADMTLSQTTSMLNGFEATEAEIAVEKPDGRKMIVRVYRESQFNDAVALPGLTLLKAKDKPIKVIENDSSGAAHTSAAQIGDELLRVDGTDAMTQTVDQLYATLRSGSHRLTLRRKSDGKSVVIPYTGKKGAS